MSTDDTPPHQFATFDQAWAATQQQLDRLLKTHADMLEEAAAPKEIDIAGLCAWITEELQPEHMAELLTAAVHRLLGLEALCEQIRTQARLGQIPDDRPGWGMSSLREQVAETREEQGHGICFTGIRPDGSKGPVVAICPSSGAARVMAKKYQERGDTTAHAVSRTVTTTFTSWQEIES